MVTAFHKFMKSDSVTHMMKSCASALILQHKTQQNISELDTQSSLHHTDCTKKVATAKAIVTPETSPATRVHSRRVHIYFQIMVWVGVANEMNSTEWELKQKSNQLIPIMTEGNTAPGKL